GEEVASFQGQVQYEAIDDVLREVFDLLPRTESVELKRRSFNAFNAELAE
ncbi:MAG: thioredoxin family protein, partial [Cyanobacteria bacterium P01_H01_bin.15]